MHGSRLTFLNDSRFHIACLVFLIIIIYSNTLNAPFQWDESLHLVDNPLVKDFRYFAHPAAGQWSEQYKFFIDRYVAFLTFALNYRIHGLSVAGYHIVNIAIHIANSILVYLLVLLTFRTPFFRGQGPGISGQESENGSQRQGPGTRSQEQEDYSQSLGRGYQSLVAGPRSLTPKLVAFFSAALFAVHPLQTEAVTYVMQRFASLVAFFYLLSLVAYIKFRLCTPMSLRAPDGGAAISSFKARLLHFVRNDTSYSRRIFFYSVAFFSAVLAMKTKENAFTLPIVIVLYEFCFFSPSPHVPVSPRPRVFLSPRLLYLVPILLTLLIIPLTHMSPSASTQIDPNLYGQIYPQPDYLFTEFRVIITYLRLLFFPINQNIYHDYPVFHSFFNPQVMLSFLFLGALFGLGVYMIIGNRQWAIGDGIKAKDKEDDSRFANSRCFGSTIHDSRPFRLIGFGILWFFITISVESSIIPLWMLICEYRMYLPSAGVIICVVTGAFLLKEKMHSANASRILVVLFVLSIAAFSAATYLRNNLWADKTKLWEDTVKKSPNNARVRGNLGYVYQSLNMLDKAMEQDLIAIKIKPDFVLAHCNLGYVYQSLNMPDKAMEQYLITIKIKPDFFMAYYNLGGIYQGLNMPDKAIEQYLIAIKAKPDFADAHYSLGHIYKNHNMLNEAMEQYLMTIKLKPDFADAHMNLGNIYYLLNMPDQAIEQYLMTIKLKPDSADAHYNLGHIYKNHNMLNEAMEQYLMTIELKPDFADAHMNLGNIYYLLNRPDQAIEQYLMTIKLKPDFADAHLNLGFLYYKLGQAENARRELTSGLKIKPDNQQARQLLEMMSR